MNTIKKRIIIVFVVSVILLGSMFYFFQCNVQKIHTMMVEKDMEQIEDTSNFVTKLIYSEIESLIISLHSDQTAFHDFQESDMESVTSELKRIKDRYDFVSVGIVDLLGKAMDELGNYSRVEDEDYLQNIRQKKTYISNVNEVSDTMLVAVPIIDGEKVLGSVWGYYSITRISENIELLKESSRYFQIIDDEGIYISDSGNVHSFADRKDLWDELERYSLSDGITVEQIHENVARGKKGTFHFTHEGQGRYVSYEPLGIRNWYVFSVLSEEYLGDYVNEIETVFKHILIGNAGTISVILGMILFFVFQDLRLNKEQNAHLTAKNNLLFMVLQKTSDIPFEVHLANQTVSVFQSGNSEKMMDVNLHEFLPEKMLEKGRIMESDLASYDEIYQAMKEGKELPESVIKIKIDGKWNYNKVHVRSISDTLIVGFLENYDQQVLQDKKIKLINKKLQKDALTNVHSRSYFVKNVELFLEHQDFLEYKKYAALCIIDLDSFKLANDTLGHGVGDQILKDVGGKLNAITREGDFVGRLGGDEFIVFLKDVRDVDGIHKCAQKFNRILHDSYGEEEVVTISASIGIAVWKGESTFDKLYEIADKELYKVKKNGKNNYSIAADFTQI